MNYINLDIFHKLFSGSNVNVICDDWAAIHVACFNKLPNMIRLLVQNGADVNIVGDWSYAPINMLFIEYAKRERYIQPCYDEWLIKRLGHMMYNQVT